jgi:hypothetical protein
MDLGAMGCGRHATLQQMDLGAMGCGRAREGGLQLVAPCAEGPPGHCPLREGA